MSLESIIGERTAEWADTTYAFGWACDLRFADPTSGQIRLRAVRGGAGLRVTLDVRERWAPGHDPDGLGVEAHGCHLRLAAWHAQFPGSPPAIRAHRLDVSRSKAPVLMIHVHPLGSPNAVRVARPRLPTPTQWVIEIEELCWSGGAYWT